MPRATWVMLFALLATPVGCRFNVGAIVDYDAGPASDGEGRSDSGEGGTTGSTDGPRDGAAPDGARADAAAQDAPQSDSAVDPCAGMSCDDGNPCTQDGCSGGTCTHGLLSGNACGDEQVCASGACVACGEANQPCCPGNDCDDRTVCNGSAVCVPCGGSGQPCCSEGAACDSGYKCTSGTCQPCGAHYQPCCDTSPSCGAGLACESMTGTCLTCGVHYGPCCPSDPKCGGSLDCYLGHCV